MGATSLLKVKAAGFSPEAWLDAPCVSAKQKSSPDTDSRKRILFTGHLAYRCRTCAARPGQSMSINQQARLGVGCTITGGRILATRARDVNFMPTQNGRATGG